MVSTIFTNAEAAKALQEVKRTLEARTDLYDPEFLDDFYDWSFQEESGDIPYVTTNLALIPEAMWGQLKVSKNSLFSEPVWDFKDEGSPLYRAIAKVIWEQDIDGNTSIDCPECMPLCQLIRACMYYCLPQNCVLGHVRSYSSVVNKFRGFTKVARFLYKQRIFVDANGNGSYLNAHSLTEEDVIKCVEEETSIHGKLVAATTLMLWQKLSISGYLPEKYQLKIHAISDELIRKLQKERDENAGSFMPISLETLSIVVPFCVNLINNHTDEITRAYERLHPIFANNDYKKNVAFTWEESITVLRDYKTDLWKIEDFYNETGSLNSKTKEILIKTICNHPSWIKCRKTYFPIKGRHIRTATNERILEVAKEVGVDMWSICGGTIFYDLQKIRHLLSLIKPRPVGGVSVRWLCL